jgi:hypothetical protein
MSTAYGFINLQHLYSQRVNAVGVNRVYDAIRESLRVHTEELNGLMSAFVTPTTLAQEQYELAGTGTLQPLTESGTPMPVRPSGSYKVAYPIQGGGTAWATDRVTKALLTVEEANRFTWDAQRRDGDWLIRHVLAAIFTNTAWTFNDKIGAGGAKGLGDISIQPLANGDTVTYNRRSGDPATDNHYKATADAIADVTNPFPGLYDELAEHPSNSGPYLVYIPSSLRSAVGGLSEFVPHMPENVIRVANGDDEIVQAAPAIGPGDQVIGYLKSSRFWVVEWGRMPDGYMIAHATGAGAPLRMRQYPAEELQGFITEVFNPEAGLEQVNLLRFAGFGVANRVAMAVQRVGNGTYAIPTGYAAPLVQ